MRLSTQFILIGLLMAIAGLVALANPFAASLAVATIVGAMFLVSGVFQLWAAFSGGAEHRLATGLIGLLGVVVGIWLLANPMEGVVSLTLIVGIAFLVTGLLRLVMAWTMRHTQLFWLLLLSGAISALLGALVLGNIAEAATRLLGLLLGFGLIAEGAGLFTFGLMGRGR